MTYVEFKSAIEQELRAHPAGLTWKQLRDQRKLPYERACPTWTKRLETEIGLVRAKGSGRAYVWRLETRRLRK